MADQQTRNFWRPVLGGLVALLSLALGFYMVYRHYTAAGGWLAVIAGLAAGALLASREPRRSTAAESETTRSTG